MTGSVGKVLAAGFGVALCLIALTAWRLPTSGSPPGLDLRLIAVPPGELELDRVGVVASARAMQAGGDSADGALRIENITGRPLVVRLAALPSDDRLAGKVRLRAGASSETVAVGDLSSLERTRGPGILLAAHGSERINLSARIAPGARGYRGGILDVTLELRSRPAGARG